VFSFLVPDSLILIIVLEESSSLSHILVSLFNFSRRSSDYSDYSTPAVAHKLFLINLISEYLLFLINVSRQETKKGA
jgi:hypothetical protein